MSRRSDQIRIAPVEAAECLSRERWERLTHRGAHLQAWFVAAERSGWMARHVEVADPDTTRLLIPAYLVARSDHDLHDRWFGPLRGITAAIGMHLRPALVVGAPIVQTSDPIGALADVPDAAIERVFDLLQAQAERDGARAIAWPFLDPTHDRVLAIGRSRGYAAFYAGASAFLPVEWDSFDDYVASRSKNVRRTIRGDLRALDDGALRTDVTSDFGAHAGAIDDLFREFFLRRNGHPSMLPAAFFHRVAEQAEPRIVAQLTWNNAQLVGASLNLVAAGVMDGTFAALTPEHEGGAVYYNDLIYTPLRVGAGRGVRMLELGPTALYAKVLRGAKLRRRITLIRGTSAPLHAALRALGKHVAARTEKKEHDLLAPLGGFRCFDHSG